MVNVEIITGLSLISTDGATTQDFTSSGFGTPKVAIVLSTLGATDGVFEDSFSQSWGVTDGTRQWSIGCSKRDLISTTRTQAEDTELIRAPLVSTGSTALLASFDSWITDGIRITYAVKPLVAFQRTITVILINGDDYTGYVNTFDASGAGTFNVTDPGFQGKQVLVVNANGIGFPSGSSSTNAALGVGFGAENKSGSIIQCATLQRTTSAGNSSAYISNAEVSVLNAGAGLLVLDSFTATGFDVTLTGSGIEFGYLVHSIANREFWAGAFQTDTTATPFTQAVVAPDHQPEMVLLAPTRLQDINASDDTDESGVWSYSVVTPTEERSQASTNEDGVGHASARPDAAGALVPLDDGTMGTGAQEATVDIVGSGFELDFTQNNVSAQHWWLGMTFGMPTVTGVEETIEISEQVGVHLEKSTGPPNDTVEISEQVGSVLAVAETGPQDGMAGRDTAQPGSQALDVAQPGALRQDAS